jgi:hypothetical protein
VALGPDRRRRGVAAASFRNASLAAGAQAFSLHDWQVIRRASFDLIMTVGQPRAMTDIAQEPRQPGMLKHWAIPDEFWDPLTEEELALFEGSETDEWGISLPKTRMPTRIDAEPR